MRKEDWQLPVFFLGLIMGTASTLLIKATYDHGAIDPVTKTVIPYEKPIFLTFIMFLGMFFSLPLYLFLTRNAKKPQQQQQSTVATTEHGTSGEKSPLVSKGQQQSSYNSADPYGDNEEDLLQHGNDNTNGNGDSTNEDEEQFNIWSFKLMMVLMIPSLFDLLGTILSTIGLLYVSVSLYQLSRCSVIIVTALFKRLILHHKLTKANYAGVIINTIAMVLVGVAAILLEAGGATAGEGLSNSTVDMSTNPSSRTMTGLLFILASCIVQGAQYVFEEKVMSFDNVPPLVLIGFEGLNGCLLSILLAFPFAMLMPGNDNGYYEDIPAAFTLPFYSPGLFWLLVAFFLVIFLYNVFCIYITFLLSSIYHCVMDGLRPCAVWLTSLASYYILGWSGQPWSTICWFELASMILIFYGTAIYGGQAKLPCLADPTLGEEEELAFENQVVIRDTPVFSARVSQAVGDNQNVSAAGLLTQSPALRAVHSHTNNTLQQQHQHGHSSPRTFAQHAHHTSSVQPSSRAQQAQNSMM